MHCIMCCDPKAVSVIRYTGVLKAICLCLKVNFSCHMLYNHKSATWTVLFVARYGPLDERHVNRSS